jgi:hypothetical protein
MKENQMASLAEAMEAAMKGKKVTSAYGKEVFYKKGALRWNNGDLVEVHTGNLKGWVIEEPQKLEYVDYPVVAAPTPKVEMPYDNKRDLDLIWTQAGFAGYVFVQTDGTKNICSYPFVVKCKRTLCRYESRPEQYYDGITWCDFVRFTGRSQ